MAFTNPSSHYAARLQLHLPARASLSKRIIVVSRLRLLFLLAAVGFGIAAIQTAAGWQWMVAGGLMALFLALVRVHTQLHHKEMMLKLRVEILEGEMEALAGKYAQFPQGNAFVDPTHPYSFDLDIFGSGSVYQLLCRTVTVKGGVALANILKEPQADELQIFTRQEMIKELARNPVFLEDFRAAGSSTPEQPGDDALVRSWLDAPNQFINNVPAKIAIAVLPLACMVLIGYGIVTATFPALIFLVVAANWMVLGYFSKHIKINNAQVGRTANLVEKYQLLQEVAANITFTHPQLSGISKAAIAANASVAQFRKLAHMFDSRNNSLAGPLVNSLFIFDVFCLLRLESWRQQHRSLLQETMNAMIDLDVLVSCANYAFNHPENNYPLMEGNALHAIDLRHPLLAKGATGNDFSLGVNEHIYLLTGANMTGKSTFIRTVGIAAVLAYAGLPVPAQSLSLPLMQLYTSIRVTDSVQDDVSYFRAELNRIKAIMDTVKASASPYLVLLDEPLRGTNSGDKQQGTRSIIESLLRERVMGIVATHDIGLCILQEEYPHQVSNYHFESTITPGGLAFDFKLYPGGSTSNNATILMRQMGIIA